MCETGYFLVHVGIDDWNQAYFTKIKFVIIKY